DSRRSRLRRWPGGRVRGIKGHRISATVQVGRDGVDYVLVFLLVPTVGSFYPLPAYPVYLFPYIFLAYMVVGAGWLFVASRRRRGILREIETDLEAAS
ncbi:MAG: amino acid permease, partial [Pseudonocardiales bacterium]|nr:amino acid permease [Pseudonocardiales bacterium]